MSMILHINTALGKAITGISSDMNIIAVKENSIQKDHASFLQPAIREMLSETGLKLSELDAVAVVNGPGSYTGLRVGLSAAKGICFALQKPLITLSTLEWMAIAFRFSVYDFICPLIDARRMEVFTATYDRNLSCVSPPVPKIIDESSFHELLDLGTVLFTGNATGKLPETLTSKANAIVSGHESSLLEQVILATEAYDNNAFADLAYSEPFYGKDFFSPHTVQVK